MLSDAVIQLFDFETIIDQSKKKYNSLKLTGDTIMPQNFVKYLSVLKKWPTIRLTLLLQFFWAEWTGVKLEWKFDWSK